MLNKINSLDGYKYKFKLKYLDKCMCYFLNFIQINNCLFDNFISLIFLLSTYTLKTCKMQKIVELKVKL